MLRKSVLALLLLPALAGAAERNDLPSCYQFAQLGQHAPPPSGRELDVVIDETTQLTDDLKRGALAHVLRYMVAGDRIRIYRISAFMPESYLKLEYAGQLDAPLSQEARDDTGSSTLKKLDACMAGQMKAFKLGIAKKLAQSFGDESKKIAKSEILFSLKQIAADLVRKPVEHRTMLLISDMLENSDFASFYSKNQIRRIDAEAELKRVESNELFASLSNAKIYVHGAGLVPAESKSGYRSGKTMQALESFWRGYFERSSASLEGFGTPSLTADLE